MGADQILPLHWQECIPVPAAISYYSFLWTIMRIEFWGDV